MTVRWAQLAVASVRNAGSRPLLCSRLQGRLSSTSTRQWSTPLAKTLSEVITTTGPVSIAQFMRQCLTSDLGGYYSNSLSVENKDQFGTKGDFITSPEISQVFGELVGVWFVTEWLAQGQVRSGIQLMELGPGRGTLMEDALRSIANFKTMATAVDSVVLIETSPVLRKIQHERLCGDSPILETSIGYESKSKHLPDAKVVWSEDLKLVPSKSLTMPMIVAHEFFDALPIHAFQSVEVPDTSTKLERKQTSATNQWRELLVSPSAPPSTIEKPSMGSTSEFELSVSAGPTHHSRVLPQSSRRYQAILPMATSTIEISPESQAIAGQCAQLIGRTTTQSRVPAGAALFIDYGPSNTVPISTLRGIRNHKHCTPFSNAGLVDISADVDFGALVESSLRASEKVEAHGPVEQADWLHAMGGRQRIQSLISRVADQDVRHRLQSGWDRLVAKGPNGMGRLYKILCVLPLSGGKRTPVGFGGGVVSDT